MGHTLTTLTEKNQCAKKLLQQLKAYCCHDSRSLLQLPGMCITNVSDCVLVSCFASKWHPNTDWTADSRLQKQLLGGPALAICSFLHRHYHTQGDADALELGNPVACSKLYIACSHHFGQLLRLREKMVPVCVPINCSRCSWRP